MAMVGMDLSEIEKTKGDDEVVAGSLTKLEKPVQELILRIFDKDMCKTAPQSCEVKMGVQAPVDPIDVYYLKLKSQITVLPKSSPDYKMIETYRKNTNVGAYAPKIEITDVFCVSREGEEKRFKQQLGNRMLLWHGSRLSNIVGILSQGLRIAPPEASSAGTTFGKGIYFADMVSKSADYCYPHLSGNDAFLLLCEVALGTVQEMNCPRSGYPLKNGCTAVKGMGYQFPDPSNVYNHPDGFVVPYGKATSGLQRICLEYNEYVVFDMSQVRIRYLVRTKMNRR